jgi:DNA polymerase-3 subunit delta'
MARLIAAHTHPDLKRLERLPKDSKILEKGRAEWPDDVELARGITVDQVRALGASFANAPSMSRRRVVIIDSVDDLERAGANALLKNLEEPPAGTIFLLVSHAPGRLLPTIRSRCRVLRFAPLDDAAMTSVLNANLPEIDPDERAALIATANGSPGNAVRNAGLDVDWMVGMLELLARDGDASNALRVALAAKLSPKAAQGRYEAFLDRVPSFIAQRARHLQGEPLGQALLLWEKARELAAGAVQGSLDTVSVVHALSGHVAALAPPRNNAKA